MNEKKFLENFIAEFEEEPNIEIDFNTKFKDLDGWDSMTSMMIITMIDENYNVVISPDEMKQLSTIKELYNLI